MIPRGQWQNASYHAADVTRWAMYLAAKGDGSHPGFAESVHQSLAMCAAALGYKLVKADATDVAMSR